MTETSQVKAAASSGGRLSPSAVVAFAVMASIPVKVLADRIIDPDLWWHLKTGELIVRNRALPSVDPFSYTAAGEPWVVQEWLSEVIFHGIRSAFGLYGILAYRALLLFVVYALMARLILKRMGGGLATWALIALAAYTGIPNWTERPNLMSFALFVGVLLLLERKDKAIWWFVPIAVLWANLHGMVILGIGLVAVVAVAEWLKVWTRWEGADRAWATRLALVTGAGALASLVNPEGPGLLVHAFRLVRVASAIVSEWRSPNFHDPGAWFFLGLLLLMIMAFVFSPRRPDPTDVALGLAFTVMALQAVRNLAVAGIVLGVVTAPSLKPAFGVIPWRPRARKDVSASSSRLLGTAGMLATAFALAAVLVTGFPRSSAPRDIVQGFPVESIDALDRPGVRVFAYDAWAPMVIDRAWPNARVYIDLRWDFYGLELSNTYAATIDGTGAWREHLDQSCTTHVLIPPEVPLAEILRLAPEWSVEHRERFAGEVVALTYSRRAPARGCSGLPADVSEA